MGLGGRDVVENDFEEIVERCEKTLRTGIIEKNVQWINLKKEAL